MLVIARKANECLRINDDVQIKVTKIDGAAVFLGITAPKHVLIVRAERDESVLGGDGQKTNHALDSAGHE